MGQALGVLLAVLLSTTLLLSATLRAGIGAPRYVAEREGVTDVRGYLTGRQDHHYLGLHVEERFTTVELTLTVDPIGATQLEGSALGDDTINFLVLTELGLQRFLSGADPWDVNLAAGTEVVTEDGSLQLTTDFRAVGRGGYTVLVFNSSNAPAAYHLQVVGGRLIDGAGQTHPVGHILSIEQIRRGLSRHELAAERFEHAAPTLTALPVMALGRPASSPLRAEALGGRLDGDPLGQSAMRHYFVLEPTAVNRDMTLSLTYELSHSLATATEVPNKDDAAALDLLAGAVNYWVFTAAGLRQLDQGAPAEFLSLASGAAFLGVPNLLRTKVRLAGQTAYVVVVFNETEHAIDYRLRVEGGSLVDLYHQSTEAAISPAQLGREASDPAPLAELALTPAIAKELESAPQSQTPNSATREEPANALDHTAPSDGADTTLDTNPLKANEHSTDEPDTHETPTVEDESAPPSPAPYRLPLFQAGYFEELVSPLVALAHPTLDNLTLGANSRQTWTLRTDSAFSRVIITLEGSSRAASDLAEVRIWVVSKEGLRRVEWGMAPHNVTVAGFTALHLGRDQRVLQASFDAAGYEPYTVVVENAGAEDVAFRLHVRNGAFQVARAAATLPQH